MPQLERVPVRPGGARGDTREAPAVRASALVQLRGCRALSARRRSRSSRTASPTDRLRHSGTTSSTRESPCSSCRIRCRRRTGERIAIRRYVAGGLAEERTVRTPLRAPLSFVARSARPAPPADASTRGSASTRSRAHAASSHGGSGRARFVVLWSVDFVPDRFGRGTLATRVYDRLDRSCLRQEADARVELSEAAREARTGGITCDRRRRACTRRADGRVDRPRTDDDAGSFARRRVVYLGHLVERQGVDTARGASRRTPRRQRRHRRNRPARRRARASRRRASGSTRA